MIDGSLSCRPWFSRTSVIQFDVLETISAFWTYKHCGEHSPQQAWIHYQIPHNHALTVWMQVLEDVENATGVLQSRCHAFSIQRAERIP